MKSNRWKTQLGTNIENGKPPQFVIFTDRDGTIDLGDKKLNGILKKINIMGGIVIPTTGRTVGDMIESLKNADISPPDIIIGDNGANIYSCRESRFINKMLLEHEKVIEIINQFINNGGNSDLIRYTDGSTIVASKDKYVERYYKNSKVAVFSENIEEAINHALEVTKITLAGTKEDMEKISKYIKTLGYWTDIGATKFPTGTNGNYRLDIAQNNINKGNAVKKVTHEIIQPRYGYICVGNGENDIPMFKQAIDDGMIAAIMKNSPPEIIKEMKKYAKDKPGRVILVPENKTLANEFLLKIAKIFESKMKAQQEAEKRAKKRNERLPNVQRVKTSGVSPKGRFGKNARNRENEKII